MKGPIESSEENDDKLMKDQSIESLIAKNKELEEKTKKLEGFLMSLREKPLDISFFDFDDYKDDSIIGEGAMSSVNIVIKEEKYAKKVLKDFSYKNMQGFIREVEILFKIPHPCIIRIIAVNYGDEDHPPSLILALESTSLEKVVSKKEINDNLKCRIVVEIVLGMRYIHQKGFMHRDLKPSNILLSKELHVRISDFGLAREEDLETSQSKGVGTLRFMAPELFDESENETKYTNKVDVYSFGITLIYIITGRYPTFSLKNVVTGTVPSLPSTIPVWVRDLILSCISLSPDNRPSFSEIFNIIKMNNYDFFNDNKDKKLTEKQLNLKKEIEARVLEIEAFEYQHKND